MLDAELPNWMDKTGLGTVGTLTRQNGKQTTVEIVDFDDDRQELVVEDISRSHADPNEGPTRHSIPVDEILDFEPQPRSAQRWPYSDPCQSAPFSFARFVLMSTMFLGWTVGSIPLFLVLVDKPYGVKGASAISYSILVVWTTFAATRSWHRFMFKCPAVRPQIPRLLLRHLGFLVALFVIQTAALAARPNLPAWWNTEDTKGMPPFIPILGLVCMGLGFVEIYSNRSLLERAHREFSE
jgi:uncharacterized membrane protein